MSPRATTVLAWSLAGVTAALIIAGVGLSEQASHIKDVPPLAISLLIGFLAFVDAAVGAAVATRHPRNAVGWLFLLFPFGLWLQIVASSYVTLGLPNADYAKWATAMGSALFFGAIIVALLLFPDGRLPSRRWRWVAWLPLVAFLQVVPFDVVAEGWLQALVLVSYVVALAAALAALIARFRSSRGIVRLQLKWIAYAGTLVVVSMLVLVVTLVAGYQQLQGPAFVGFLASFALVPVMAGLAILRFHLYDIELVIRRTIVYGATTLVLAATFFGGILIVQALLSRFTAGNELAVAGSTLVTVAFFQPLRTRIREAVDRQFYRSRYDAALTLDAFSSRLADEVDLDAVRAELVTAVRDTMQPAHASVWIR